MSTGRSGTVGQCSTPALGAAAASGASPISRAGTGRPCSACRTLQGTLDWKLEALPSGSHQPQKLMGPFQAVNAFLKCLVL